MNRSTIAATSTLLVAVFVAAAWGQARPSEQHSPHGSVPFGTPNGQAFAPNGRLMAREVDPRDMGRIGIFSADGTLVREIAVGETRNDLKGIAWSPDSATLAVMYHHQYGSYIALHDAATGTRVALMTIDHPYNYMRFDQTGRSLSVRTKDGRSVTLPIRR
jgi:hypothetical protein